MQKKFIFQTNNFLKISLFFATTLMCHHTIASSPAPWQKPAISYKSISPIYQQEWKKSPTKKTCPILALSNRHSAQMPTAKSRRAIFFGGWAVAYDLSKYRGKKLRSAYGVANSDMMIKKSDFHHWQQQINYSDGSFVTYGREGDFPDGKWLAYILLPNGCFYNVWSQIDEDHLVEIINGLRFVK